MTELNWTATVALTIHDHPFVVESDVTGVVTMRLAQTACTNNVQVRLHGHKGDLERLLQEGHPHLTETKLV
jgi:hypothetical protein